MSPLLFVILLGLLAGFALFALVIGVGALTSALLNKRRNRREANSERQVATGEFATVLAGKQPAAEAETAPQSLAQVYPPIAAREAEPAQAFSAGQRDEEVSLSVVKDKDAAAAAEIEPATNAGTAKGHRGSKSPTPRRRAKSEPKPNESSAAVEQPDLAEPDVVLAGDSVEPELSEPALAKSDRDIASVDRSDLQENAQRAPVIVEVQPQVEPAQSVGEPLAQAPGAAQMAASTPRRGGLFPKRVVESTPGPEVAAAIPEQAEAPAEAKSALEDPFAAVLAAVNKH